MKIILDPEWYIEDDGSSYTLTKYTGRTTTTTDKKGVTRTAEIYEHQSYPPTLVACVEKYVRLSLVEKNKEMELKEYLRQFQEAYQKLNEWIRFLGITR